MKRILMIIILFLVIATTASASSWYDGNLSFVDVTVCTEGNCDYSSIATAITTEGGSKTYYIKRGTYSEGDIQITASNIRIIWDDVTISFGSNDELRIDGSYCTFEGRLTITGDGGSYLILAKFYSDYFDGSRCLIRFDLSTLGGSIIADGIVCKINGSDHSYYNIEIPAKGSALNYAYKSYLVALESSVWTRLNLRVGDNSQTQAYDLYGLWVDNSDYSEVHAQIGAITAGGTGFGIRVDSDADYNYFDGVSEGSDVEYQDLGGAGNVNHTA